MNGGQKDSKAEREIQEVSLTRRALLRAGWAVPVVLALNPPKNVFAESSGPADPIDDGN